MKSLVSIGIGVLLNYYGWKMLLKISDKRMTRFLRFWPIWLVGNNEDREAQRLLNGSLLSVMLIVIGSLLIALGVASFFKPM